MRIRCGIRVGAPARTPGRNVQVLLPLCSHRRWFNSGDGMKYGLFYRQAENQLSVFGEVRGRRV